MFILPLSVLYVLPFGKNIMKFDFFIFRESLLVWNQVVIFCNSSFISLISVSKSIIWAHKIIFVCEHGIDWCHLQIVLGLRHPLNELRRSVS